MKYARIVLHGAVMVLFFLSIVAAGIPEGTDSTIDWQKAKENYITALKSSNTGVQASAAYHIHKYNLTGATQELKSLLEKSSADNVKMSVALALVTVAGEEGKVAVEDALQKEDNELVAEFYRSILATNGVARN